MCKNGLFVGVTPGYQREVDSLLAVNKQSVMSDGENLETAEELLHTVCEESSLFPSGIEPSDRFLFVMVTYMFNSYCNHRESAHGLFLFKENVESNYICGQLAKIFGIHLDNEQK